MTQPTTDQHFPTTPPPEDAPLRSVFTSSLAEIFAQLNISLVVSTYQAGKVILVRYANQTTSGVAAEADPSGSSETQELVGSFTLDIDPEAPVAPGYTLFLPVVTK